MTHPPTTPGPDEPSPDADFVAPAPPPPGPDAAYDPSQSYVVYQAAPGGYGPPAGGYGVPVLGAQAGYDPMISPDYSGWWARSFAILRNAWPQLLVLQAIGFLLAVAVAIPEAFYSVGVLDDLNASMSNSSDPNFDGSALFGVFGLVVLGLLASSLIACVITVAGNHIAVSAAIGAPKRLGAAFALAGRRFLPLWGWQLLAGIITLVGFCACVLPGIYVYAALLVIPAVVTFERGGSAIGRCFQLFHRDLGSSVARVATIVGLSLVVAFVSYLVGQIVELAIGGSTVSSVGADGPVVTTATTTALIASSVVTGLLDAGMKLVTDVLLVTAYADMRARTEPLSSATLATEIGIADAATPSAWIAPPMPPLA
ncbi:hypothetical protein [Dactylosporangium sp. CA-092794]|uniref:hypothetical protein n=1 Tax=Dactylosporangium sp. CA-092794 TaxID=3239929 RepID=UPI003D8F8157